MSRITTGHFGFIFDVIPVQSGDSSSSTLFSLTNLLISFSILIYGQKKDEFFIENGISYYSIKNVKLKGFSRLFTQKKIQKLINKLVKENKVELHDRLLLILWKGSKYLFQFRQTNPFLDAEILMLEKQSSS